MKLLSVRTYGFIFGLIQYYFLPVYECKKLEGYKFPVYSTETCPRNKTEWIQRSDAINCTEDSGYLCLPNENITELLEFCFTSRFIWIQEGICLYLVSHNSLLNAYSCIHFLAGCPNSSVPSYNLFEYPGCTTIGNGCFLSDSSCKSLTSTTDPQTITEHVYVGNNVFNWAVFGTMTGVGGGMIFMIVLCVYFKKEISNCKMNCDVENREENTFSQLIPRNQTQKIKSEKEGVRSSKIMTDKRATVGTDREEPKIESIFEEMLIKGGDTSMKEEVLIIDPSLDTFMTENHETPSVTGNNDTDMKNTNSELQDKAEHIGPWTENIESGDLHKLFGSFCIEIPEDPDRLSFTKAILGESELAEFVEEIRSLARNVVLYKYLRDEEKKPGTVYLYEVNVKYTANQVVIEDKDARQKLDFFQRKNQNLVKVILIKGGFHRVLQAKKKAYQKYKQYFNFERFYLHHESEEYTEVAKLSAHRKIVSYKEFVESVRESIPLQNIEQIVKDAVNRVLSKESITELCFDVVIRESGDTNSNPYYCRSGSTINVLKKELLRRTVDSVNKYLGSEICNEIQRHIQTDIQSRFSIDTDSIYTVPLLSNELFFSVIAFILHPVLGVLIAFLSVVGTNIFAVNVNSQSWRRNVANEIYKHVDKNKEKIVTELSSNIRTRCKITADHLKLIADSLEEFTSSIHLNDQDTRSWEDC